MIVVSVAEHRAVDGRKVDVQRCRIAREGVGLANVEQDARRAALALVAQVHGQSVLGGKPCDRGVLH